MQKIGRANGMTNGGGRLVFRLREKLEKRKKKRMVARSHKNG